MVIGILNSLVLIFLFIAFYSYFDRTTNGKNKLSGKLNGFLKTKKEGKFSYERINQYLKSLGNPFKLSPMGYLTGKILIAAVFMISCVIGKLYVLAVILGIIGYFTLDLIMYIKDKEDMKEIKFQFRNVYDLLNIQAAAGVFIRYTLTDCYLVVSNARLKRNLALLSAEISITNNIDKALDNFQGNFKECSEIDNFILLIKQTLQTGQSRDQLADISEELSDLSLLRIQQNTKRVKNTATVIQLLIFVGIFMTVLYFVGIEILQSSKGLLT